MLTIQYAKNPWYSDAEGVDIQLTVKFEEFAEEMPFCANADDPMSYGRELHANALRGDYGTIAPYIPPPVPSAEDNKITATQLLASTDWTAEAAVADPAVSNPYLMNQADFLAYRSAVREIAVNPVAGNLVWPVKPQEVWSS